MERTPPSEDEFNNAWLTPMAVIAFCSTVADVRKVRQWVMERLKGMVIDAVCRQAQILPDVPPQNQLTFVPARMWSLWIGTDGDDQFWATGDATFSQTRALDSSGYGTVNDKFRYFNVRFDPAGLPWTRSLAAASNPIEERPALATVKLKKDLPRPEAERFSRAILSEWPNTTERDAHQKAKLFFPDNNVPKHWFLEIFGSIRGPKIRGQQPKERG